MADLDVYPGDSIIAAVAAAQYNDRVRVAGGTFGEHILLRETITLSGGWNQATWASAGELVTTIGGLTGDENSPIQTRTDGATMVVEHFNVLGPVDGQKLYTVRPSGGSRPTIRNCTIYGGIGNDPLQSKIETLTPWNAHATYEDCVFWGGQQCVGSHRTVLESGDSSSIFRRCVFYPAEWSLNPGCTRFWLISTLDNASYTQHVELHDCVCMGANAGPKTSFILKLFFDNPTVWDFSKFVVSGCDFVLGISDNMADQYYDDAPVSAEATITGAGGTWENNTYWASKLLYDLAHSGGGGPAQPRKPENLRLFEV